MRSTVETNTAISTFRSRGARCAGAALALALLITEGCDRHDQSTAHSAPVVPSAVSPAPARPATRPAATITVDGRVLAFPAAKLVISRKSDGLDAVLCSDDPPAAIQPGYLGNSFFFEMRLDVDDPQDLAGAVWTSKVPDREAADSPNGIFLTGARQQLQPADVRVTFTRKGEQLVANLSGRFLDMEKSDPAGPARSVEVAGSLEALVQQQ